MKKASSKRCNTCQQLKPLTAFSPRGNGYKGQCRACIRARINSKVYSDITEKTCATCQQTLSIVHFYKRVSPDGYSKYCKACERPRLKLYYANKKRQAFAKHLPTARG